MILAHQSDNKFTVITPNGILGHRLDRGAAMDAIFEEFPDAEFLEVEQILNEEPEPALWRSLWAMAVQSETVRNSEKIENLGVEDLRERLHTAIDAQLLLEAQVTLLKVITKELKQFKQSVRQQEVFKALVESLAQEFNMTFDQVVEQFTPMINARIEELGI